LLFSRKKSIEISLRWGIILRGQSRKGTAAAEAAVGFCRGLVARLEVVPFPFVAVVQPNGDGVKSVELHSTG
jgi:hypothetical protein